MGIPLHLFVHKMHNSYYIGYNGVRVGVKREREGKREREKERERELHLYHFPVPTQSMYYYNTYSLHAYTCTLYRYDNLPGGTGSTPSLSITEPVGDRLTQMDYFHDTRWQWIVPLHNPIILNALLR